MGYQLLGIGPAGRWGDGAGWGVVLWADPHLTDELTFSGSACVWGPNRGVVGGEPAPGTTPGCFGAYSEYVRGPRARLGRRPQAPGEVRSKRTVVMCGRKLLSAISPETRC